MNKEELIRRKQAMAVFMGYHDLKVEDMKFNESWEYMIPIWSRVRFKVPPGMVIDAIMYIDENKLEDFFRLISQVCLNWCKEQGIVIP